MQIEYIGNLDRQDGIRQSIIWNKNGTACEKIDTDKIPTDILEYHLKELEEQMIRVKRLLKERIKCKSKHFDVL